jgi:hypothetical protein
LGFDFRRILGGHLLIVNSVQIISTTHRSQLGLIKGNQIICRVWHIT